MSDDLYTEVVSSNISSLRFEPYQETDTGGDLFIRFLSGSEYRYTDVPETIVAELLSAESVGRYFNHKIRFVYSSTRLDDYGPDKDDDLEDEVVVLQEIMPEDIEEIVPDESLS